jgi:hypothetical protein
MAFRARYEEQVVSLKREMIIVYSENHEKSLNIRVLCAQNTDPFKWQIKAVGLHVSLRFKEYTQYLLKPRCRIIK